MTKRTVDGGDLAVETVVEIPRKLGSVVLQRQIGQGGMGVVWLGRHELLNRDVAVKFLLNLKPATDDPGFEVMLEGARAAAAIVHEGLNRVLHADVIDGVPFLVMEFVEGPTVGDLVCVHGALSLSVTRSVMERLCHATSELHDNGVVHRDIKPSNILLSPDSKPVLTDFGLACFRSGEELQFSVPTVAGTPVYMAPEMWDCQVSARSDVYALGVVLFELLTGRVPFEGTVQDIERAHRQSRIPDDALAGIPPDIAALIERCTNKNPIYRYKSARHLARAIEEAFDSLDDAIASKSKGDQELPRLVRAIRSARMEDVPSQDHAPSSYYDRIGTLAGTRKKSGAALESAAADELVERVKTDIPCVHCGRNLNGEPLTGRCADCLWLVRHSLDGVKPKSPPVVGAPGSDAKDPKPAVDRGFKDLLREFLRDFMGR